MAIQGVPCVPCPVNIEVGTALVNYGVLYHGCDFGGSCVILVVPGGPKITFAFFIFYTYVDYYE
jgi:hypothetical protein